MGISLEKQHGGMAVLWKKGPVGPLNWNSISNLANQNNEVFITKKETQSNPQISSVKWLPYSIVLFAADLDT